MPCGSPIFGPLYKELTLIRGRARSSEQMLALLLSIIRFLRLLFSGHQAVAIENAALRLQLAAFQRQRQRPVLKTFDRVFWITLRHFWSGWRGSLLYVT